MREPVAGGVAPEAGREGGVERAVVGLPCRPAAVPRTGPGKESEEFTGSPD